MSDPFRQRAEELRARAASERDPTRQRYLAGLASAYEELSRFRGEPEPPELPAIARADRAQLATALRVRGYSQSHIAQRLGVSQQLVSVILRSYPARG